MKEQNKFARRQFLKISAVGSAGMVFSSKLKLNTEKPQKKDIIYRTLGRTGYKVPVVSLGALKNHSKAMVNRALDAGVKHLDTAHVYNGGEHEKFLGELLKSRSRNSYIIATKIALPKDKESGTFSKDDSEELFMKNLNTSLERLQMDYVDILYVHAVSTRKQVLDETILKALQQAKKEGKVKFTGVSTHKNEVEVIDAAIESEFYDVILTTYNFQQTHHKEVLKAMKRAADAGMGNIVMKVMAGGYYDKEKTKQINGKAAMKWALQKPYVHTAIPSCKTFDHLEENLSVLYDLKMKRKERKAIEFDDTTGSLFCPGCNKCTEQCSKKWPIPDIMRAYMYGYGYGEMKNAQNELFAINLPDNPCGDCTDCTISTCTKNFDIREKITDIARLKSIPQEFIS